MFPCSSNPNTFQTFSYENIEEEDLDFDLPESNVHYIASENSQQLDIKIMNLRDNPERVAILADQNRIVIVNSNANEFEFDINPSLTEKYKNISQINYEDEFGNVRTLRNDGSEPGFVIREQSQAQMMAIARTVNRVSLRILQEKKKSSEISKEGSEHREVSIKPEFESKINLKHAKIQEISPDEDKMTDVTCKTFRATLKSQEDTGQTIHHKKQKESKELADEKQLHQKIIAKEVTQFELDQEIINDDYLKTTQRVEKLHEEALIPEILTANH